MLAPKNKSMFDATIESIKILTNQSRHRSDLVYTMLRPQDLWSINSTYLNLGYWPDAENIDQASRQLAELISSKAKFDQCEAVLDAGCGLGDQCVDWAQNNPNTSFVAIDNAESQIQHARNNVEAANLDERITFYCLDATKTGFNGESFDAIVALESAFHFNSRQDFIEHAMHLLRPGGILVMADFIKSSPLSIRQKLALKFGTLSWQIPIKNLCDIKEYRTRIEQAGFIGIEVENITEQVITPFSKFIKHRISQSSYKQSSQVIVRLAAMAMVHTGFLDSLNYVIASARKP